MAAIVLGLQLIKDNIEIDMKRVIILLLAGVILFFLIACIFNDVIPICHWLFNCDHLVHQ
jgi:hypothetical protein